MESLREKLTGRGSIRFALSINSTHFFAYSSRLPANSSVILSKLDFQIFRVKLKSTRMTRGDEAALGLLLQRFGSWNLGNELVGSAHFAFDLKISELNQHAWFLMKFQVALKSSWSEREQWYSHKNSDWASSWVGPMESGSILGSDHFWSPLL